MKKLCILDVIAIAVSGTLMALSSNVLAWDKFISLGTSSKSGVYYPVGAEICNLLNENRDQHLVRCLAYETGGSIYNIQALRSGELDVAITRSDLAYLAASGQGIFNDVGPMPGLRIISSLYDNPLGVIVKADSTVTVMEDLLGLRINIGNLGSGKRHFSDLLFKVMNWKASDFESVSELSTSKMGMAFCNGETDALIQLMGIPAPFYDEMINQCGGRFVAISDDMLARIKNEAAFIEKNIIPGGMYSSNPDDTQTIGAKAVLITMARVDEETIFELTSAIFDNFERLKGDQPAMGDASVDAMVQEGIYVPFHPGTTRYLKKRNIDFKSGQGQ